MSTYFTESTYESAVIELFVNMGWTHVYAPDLNRTDYTSPLLDAAAQIAQLYKQGEELGLSPEEMAFYDALTKLEAIRDFYQNDQLVAMTRELTEMLRKNRTIDWQRKETARAGIQKMVKRLLRKYDYSPEGMKDAISTLIR